MNELNFCVLPFIHFATQTDGTSRLCCKVPREFPITNSEQIPYNLNHDSITDIFHSIYMKDIRSRFLKDDSFKPKQCNVCYQEEKCGIESKRQRENKKWYNIVDNIKIDHDPKILYFDLRLGNLCNLKCRMCWPHFSSQIYKEQVQFNLKNEKVWYNSLEEILPWWENKKFWKNLKDLLIDNIELNFVGGEPSLHEDMYDILQYLCEKDIAKSVSLKITTNLTNLQERFIKFLPYFKNVNIDVSIDGVGKTQEYIRYPSKWSIIEKNLLSLTKIKNDKMILTISTCVQIYNIFTLIDLMKWYVHFTFKPPDILQMGLMLNLVYDPSRLNIKNLNDKGKKIAEKYLRECLIYIRQNAIDNIDIVKPEINKNDKWKWHQYRDLRERIKGIINYMNSNERNEQESKDFIDYTKQLDNHREQNFNEVIPNYIDYVT